MKKRRLSLLDRRTRARVCPNCAYLSKKPVKRCPRCDTEMAKDREENLTDKRSADSFPASDPPSY
jgi:uncharacterized paraquat-inducible protein A